MVGLRSFMVVIITDSQSLVIATKVKPAARLRPDVGSYQDVATHVVTLWSLMMVNPHNW